MFCRFRSFLCAGALFFGVVGSAVALDLATFDIIDQGGGLGDLTGIRVSILDNIGGAGPPPAYQVGDYLLLTPADVGSTFTITALTDADFTTFKQKVTDGIGNTFGYFINEQPAGGVGTTGNESFLFAAGTHSFGPGSFSSIGQLSGPDYAGYDIDSITLTINSFTLISGGGSHSIDFRATATIVGVPEASTMLPPAMATLFLAAQLYFRRLRRSR